MPSLRSSLVVLTADQVDSRSGDDAVPSALRALRALPSSGGSARGFARTAGDEIQALFTRSSDTVEALEQLARLGCWRVGVGIGAVVTPVPDDVRAASGEAFIAAREAVEASRLVPARVAVRAPSAPEAGADLDAALALLHLLWHRRTPAGWAVAELLGQGLTGREVAAELDITPSAVSQRARAAAVEESDAGMRLATRLMDAARARSAEGRRRSRADML